MATILPSSGNQNLIDTQIVAGSTILASTLNSVLTNLNLTGFSMGTSLGNFSNFSAPFSEQATVIDNIVSGYNAAISLINTSGTDPGALIYKHQNLGGF